MKKNKYLFAERDCFPLKIAREKYLAVNKTFLLIPKYLFFFQFNKNDVDDTNKTKTHKNKNENICIRCFYIEKFTYSRITIVFSIMIFIFFDNINKHQNVHCLLNFFFRIFCSVVHFFPNQIYRIVISL